MSGPARYCGRDFSAAEIEWIRARAQNSGSRRQLSRQLCEHLGWHRPDGGLKDMSARVALGRMHRDGLIALPPAAPFPAAGAPADLGSLPETDPPSGKTPPASLEAARPLEWQIVRAGPESRIWNSFVERYHYLGHTRLPGAQMRYLIRARDGPPLALLGFGAAAWKTAPRDRFIGWDADTRQRNLPRVVNNARFLILPWVTVPNLASHILAEARRRLPHDWQRRYALAPALLETFCETPRFAGTCYRAAGWTRVGQTQGRGKMDRFKERALPVKDIWLRPLQKNWRQILNA